MIWKTYVAIGFMLGIVLARWPVGSCERNPAPSSLFVCLWITSQKKSRFLLPKKKVMDFVGI